jgi:hypothetical protein
MNEAVNKQFGAIKFDSEKPRMDLIDPYAEEMMARALTFGANKYSDHNWRKGMAYSRLIASSKRHINSFTDGEDLDPESGLPHLAHAMSCMMFLLAMTKYRPDMDDRWRVEFRPAEQIKTHGVDSWCGK